MGHRMKGAIGPLVHDRYIVSIEGEGSGSFIYAMERLPDSVIASTIAILHRGKGWKAFIYKRCDCDKGLRSDDSCDNGEKAETAIKPRFLLKPRLTIKRGIVEIYG